MDTTSISAEGLGKRYQIAQEAQTYGRLTESLAGMAGSLASRFRHGDRTDREWYWALEDVTFNVQQGDVVGVIGRNGAGKSTLLKLMSRITEPTTGRITLDGRVGSLLEVGTGFHPELSGRENVYLSGAILGMKRREIAKKFDEIVAFAGIDRFLDTPVKRYSSGMQVRLGFAVAAHLDPEILFIDEVLAVGDAEFQRKCLGKMAEIGRSGRSIMFVSHSMPSVLRLCDRAILLDQGRLTASGPTETVIRAYMESESGRTSERSWTEEANAPGDDVARLKRVRVFQAGSDHAEEADIRKLTSVEVEYWTRNPGGLLPSVNLHFYNEEGICLFVSNDWNDRDWNRRQRRPGIVKATCQIPGNFLAEGRISVLAAVTTYNPQVVHAIEHDAVSFYVVDRSEGDGARGEYANDWPGVVRPMLEWHVEQSKPD